jgi:hypothetical protein
MRLTASHRRICTSLALITFAMAGCSTMSKNECLTVDWRTVGYEDGVAGYPGDRIAQHRKACAKYGVSTDLTLYQAGRELGLREYCQPANGYRIGERGGSYGGICPADLEPGFISSFEAGHQLYTLQARVSDAESELNSKRRELDRLQRDIASSSATAISSDTDKEDRKDAVIDTAKMAERAGRLKAEIRQLESDRINYQRDLDEYRAGQPPIS